MRRLTYFFVLFLAFVGCQKTEKKQTQVLKINFQEGDLPSLHPHELVIHLRGLSISKALFEPLTRTNAEGEIVLAAAEAIDLSDDQLRYTFYLRHNNWSDGTPVTASHYEKAWKAALSPKSTCSRADLLYPILNAEAAKKGEVALDAVGVKAIDDHILQVDLAYPNPHFLELTAQAITFPIYTHTEKEPTVFNGPFIVDEWKKSSHLSLKPNPEYWDRKNIALNKIEISFIEDINTAYSLFEKGDIDWIGVPFCPLSAEIIAHEKMKKRLKSQPIGRSFWIFLNTEEPLLASSTIRKALSLAVDRSAITDHILIGGCPSFKPLSAKLLPRTSDSTIQENAEQAKSEFETGLLELGLDRKSCPPLEISYSQQSMRKQLAEYLQETWHRVLGIEVRLKSVEWNVLRSNLEKGLFNISMAYEGAYYNDALELLERYTSDNPSNFSRWIYPPFSQTVHQAKYEKDHELRNHLLSEAEKILLDQMPIIPICSDCVLFSHSPKMRGYVIDSLGTLDVSRIRLN